MRNLFAEDQQRTRDLVDTKSNSSRRCISVSAACTVNDCCLIPALVVEVRCTKDGCRINSCLVYMASRPGYAEYGMPLHALPYIDNYMHRCTPVCTL